MFSTDFSILASLNFQNVHLSRLQLFPRNHCTSPKRDCDGRWTPWTWSTQDSGWWAINDNNKHVVVCRALTWREQKKCWRGFTGCWSLCRFRMNQLRTKNTLTYLTHLLTSTCGIVPWKELSLFHSKCWQVDPIVPLLSTSAKWKSSLTKPCSLASVSALAPVLPVKVFSREGAAIEGIDPIAAKWFQFWWH